VLGELDGVRSFVTIGRRAVPVPACQLDLPN
jgi:hypothetical protein